MGSACVCCYKQLDNPNMEKVSYLIATHYFFRFKFLTPQPVSWIGIFFKANILIKGTDQPSLQPFDGQSTVSSSSHEPERRSLQTERPPTYLSPPAHRSYCSCSPVPSPALSTKSARSVASKSSRNSLAKSLENVLVLSRAVHTIGCAINPRSRGSSDSDPA